MELLKRFKNWIVGLLIGSGILAVALANEPVGQAVPDMVRADLIVAIENRGGFEAGDVIHAFTEAHNMNVHAQHVVHPKLMPRTDGRIDAGSLLEKYLEETKEYKFERISGTEVRRTNLFTADVDIISDTPNADGEYMDVQLYIDRRLSLKPNRNLIFGTAGSEYWYGGASRITDTTMDTVWDYIEANTEHVRNKEFPFTDNEREKFLVLKVEKTKAELEALLAQATSTDAEGNIVVTKARKNKIDLTPFQQEIQQKLKDLRPDLNDITPIEK